MPDEQVRCFVGIAAADMDLHTVLAEQIARYRQHPAFTNIRWTPETFLHLTLCFLGNQPLSTVSALALHLDKLLMSVDTFALSIERCCGFPDAKSRIVAAMPVLSPALQALQLKVVEAVRAAGIDPEARPYLPHITLGRATQGRRLLSGGVPGDVLLGSGLSASGWVRTISLYRSELQPEGSHYTVIRSWRLQAVALSKE